MTTVTKPIITTAVRGTAGREWLTSVAQSPRLLDFVVANSPHMQSVLLLAIAQAESDLELHSQPAHAFATAAELLDEDVHPAWLQEPSETEMAERDVQEGTRLVFLNDLKMLYLKVTGFKPREDALQPYRKVTAINKEVLQKWHDTVVAHALARAAEPKVDELPPPPPKIDIPYLPISSFFVNLSQDACPFDQLSQQDQSIVTRLKEGRGRSTHGSCSCFELVQAVKLNPRLLQHIRANFSDLEEASLAVWRVLRTWLRRILSVRQWLWLSWPM